MKKPATSAPACSRFGSTTSRPFSARSVRVPREALERWVREQTIEAEPRRNALTSTE